ncbi:PDZ domain-containing protein [Saccharopolyspora kobensis]|uniref:endopeptidase La n=1 Tax=Saccharopolyspora kobensis TaxID=146035 RepID=A0A1H6CY19_9PSEU|nr:PDZ domain-containing protein [Saccharopolyspora kobensis]SEG77286.1 PDZ domain-containing protein [Saccharopolyspora kobensis]SFD01857.1 PDZ domain-containing protein [Saccharopolyspora kobensis]
MNRRTWTLLTSVVLVVAFGLLGAFVRVPYVALGPGPTYDTLGVDGDRPVISIEGQQTFPTGGHLNMTTVSVTDQLSMFGALGLWASGRYALAPRDLYFPPDKSEQQIEQENTEAFNDSQTTAETAALRYLGYPMKVVAGQIIKGSPADGILAPGDRLLAANGRPVTDPQSLRAALTGTKPGDRVEIRFQHADQPERVASVQLAQGPDGQQQGFLGVAAAERPDVGFEIEISLADVGGPSAGLMFTLAIIDKLTPGELNGGQFVAGTGEITPAGEVNPIGGIPFKMVKAREAGATTFLVPADNCAEAKAQAPEGLQLAKVGTLQEATKALDDLRAGKTPASC